MKKTHHDRRALLDHLEKKYIKKVQLQAFKHESEVVKQKLSAIRGTDVKRLQKHTSEAFELPGYEFIYS